MSLPEIKLPAVELPFEVPLLLHPPIDHFAMSLPVVVLLIETYNLFIKRRSVSVLSFLLLLLSAVAIVAAYQSGLVDGKEAFESLSPQGQEALKEHKTLGAYLVVIVLAALLFKLLALLGHKVLKIIYFLLLFVLAAGLYEQGQEGGKLVYTYGANVKEVRALDDKLFDLQEEFEALKEKSQVAVPKTEITPAPKASEGSTQTKHDTSKSQAAPAKEAGGEENAKSMQGVSQEMRNVAQKKLEEVTQEVQKSAESFKEDAVDSGAKMLRETQDFIEKGLDSPKVKIPTH